MARKLKKSNSRTTAEVHKDKIERRFEKLSSLEKLFLWLVLNPERGRKILEEMISHEQCSGTVG
jgi:hypothetical protein